MGNTKTLSFQKYYSNKIGSAELDKNSTTAGKLTNLKLTYHVGELGIAEGGMFKVLFSISADVPDVQFENETKDNYVSLKCSNKNVFLEGYSRSNGLKGKVHERPWNNGFIVFVKGAPLSAGDTVSVFFKNWRIQTYLEDTFKFKIAVDPFSSGKSLLIEKSPTLKVLPDLPNKLKVIAPSNAVKREKIKILLRVEDKWGNPCMNLKGKFEIVNYKKLGLRKRNHQFSKGKTHLLINTPDLKVFQIKAKFKSLEAVSNPIITVSDDFLKHYWADLHWQSGETGGTNPLSYCMAFAKDYSLLDVVSVQPNDFQTTNAFWSEIKNTCKNYNKDGEFISFPGYEWSGETSRGGDRNVIFNESNPPIHRSSHALLTDYSDTSSDCFSLKELRKKLKNTNYFFIMHIGGRKSDLASFDPKYDKAIEIHSDWGTSEWFVQNALLKDYKVGIVANSDSHNGRPGSSYPGIEEFDSQGGLTCILSDKLDRNSIFEALEKRSCYATTGARIYVDFECKYKQDNKSLSSGIGQELEKGSVVEEISLKCLGTDEIEKVELFNKDKVIDTYYSTVSKNSKFIKFLWTGYSLENKSRRYYWQGKIEFDSSKIKSVETVNFFNHSDLIHSKKSCEFKSFTTGNYQGLIFNMDKLKGGFDFEFNKIKKHVSLEKLNNKELEVILENGTNKSKLMVYKVGKKNKNPGFVNYIYKIKSSDLKNRNALYVKITQRDGNMAWTSPVYF